jgi:hypothetical protein
MLHTSSLSSTGVALCVTWATVCSTGIHYVPQGLHYAPQGLQDAPQTVVAAVALFKILDSLQMSIFFSHYSIPFQLLDSLQIATLSSSD